MTLEWALAQGSSSRMRGARRPEFQLLHLPGIIPADAGSTKSVHRTIVLSGDHPRGCGEHETNGMPGQSAPGSSPRMRGARGDGVWAECLVGIIPADAGSTEQAKLKSAAVQDHPRGCGEHFSRSTYLRSTPGSSPRMRGAHAQVLQGVQVLGIIPADAGSTGTKSGDIALEPDHPRGCGEHPTLLRTRRTVRGSSPRMRGTQTVV